MPSLRFAPLIRVSTEDQEKKGESLRTQKGQIQQYVKSLGGTIPETCWRYSGQEHATPDQERQKLDKLLADSSNGKFDAVIVCDTSRWSRDNLKSKEGLNILRNNGTRFFVGTMEYDLFNPEHAFILGMSAEIGEFQARIQALKSITNRIKRARRNVPTAGKLPFGRTFDPKMEKWGIDPEKQKKIQWAAKEYLKGGVPIPKIAKVLGMNHVNLWKIMNHRSGTEWECRFRNKDLKIDETVVLMVPPLLDQQTIQEIKEQAAANKTYERGVIKHKYLLSRLVFCKHCGYALMAQTNHNGKQYFRHPRHRKHTCTVKNWVPAEPLGQEVLLQIFQMFGDTEKIEQAIKKAMPDLSKLEAMRDELADLNENEKQTIKQRNRLVKLVALGELAADEIKSEIQPIRERLQAIQDRIDVIEPQLADQPDPERIKKKSRMARAIITNVLQNPGPKAMQRLLDDTFERQRKIIEKAFSGKDREGNRLGVYVEQTGNPDRPWKFEIRAILDNVVEFFVDNSDNSYFISY
jgi:site-specific DNA recombinase